jgi:pimeloyl-ACP methyl ester carboxylesterase
MKTHKMLVITLASTIAACSSAPGDGKTYVLVHGAWMDSGGWTDVADRLRDEGATARTFDLPAHGADSTAAGAATLDGYVERVSAEIDAAGPPVILVGHSMAGIVISQLAERRPAEIERLVYIGAYVPANGQSLFDLAMSDADSEIGPHLEFGEDGTIGVAAVAFADLFCGDCDADGKALLAASYQTEPMAPLGTPVALTADGFGSVRKTYFHTTADRVVSPGLQGRMAAAAAIDREIDLDSSHVPMLSQPDAVAHALLVE